MSFTYFYLDVLDALGRFAPAIHAQQLSILSRLMPTLLLVEDSHTVKWFSSRVGDDASNFEANDFVRRQYCK